MTRFHADLDAAEILSGAQRFCADTSSYVFKTLQINTETDSREWEKICCMMLAICEVHSAEMLNPLVADDEQRHLIARGFALSGVEEAAKSIGRQWP